MKKILILLAGLFLIPSVSAAQTPDQIREAQSLLVRTDRNPGPVDGQWGRRTEAALIDFLKSQGEDFDGELSENELKLLRAAPVGEKYANRPHRANGRRIEHRTLPSGLTTFPGHDELPMFLDPPPNDITLAYHFSKWLRQKSERNGYEVRPAGNAVPFESDLRTSAFLDRQLRESSMLSYLYYEDGRILYDGLAPAERFSLFKLSDHTDFRSQSVGKSFVSYVVGHAICEGHIPSIDHRLNDWPLIANTLYAERTMAEILDMRARDQHVVTEEDGFLKSGRWFNGSTLATHVALELEGTKPNRREIWNYSGVPTNIALSYVIFKLGDDWQAFYDRVFQDKVKIEHPFSFHKHVSYAEDADGAAWGSAYAKRYDYLRIAVAMLKDWQEETCVGQYLRKIYADRKSMNHRFDDPNRMPDVAKSYAGQFWVDFQGMRNRRLLGMNGNNGQNVLIDMDRGRIVVVNAAHTNFDWRTLVYNAIKTGKLPD